MRVYFKTATLTTVATFVALLMSPASAEARNCETIHHGKTSRVYSCDDSTVGWTLPRDALRVDKLQRPGPGAIVREVPDKLIRKPAEWLGKRLGIKW
jgi:hypothetical protein